MGLSNRRREDVVVVLSLFVKMRMVGGALVKPPRYSPRDRQTKLLNCIGSILTVCLILTVQEWFVLDIGCVGILYVCFGVL